MQENNSIPLRKIISFFKNKFDIFKNKLISKPTVPTVPTSLTQTYVHTSTPKPSISSIYISLFNTNHPNNIKVLETKIKPDIITITTTMTTVTTIHNTHSNEVDTKLEQKLEQKLEPPPIHSIYKQYIDSSKYSHNIISSLVDSIIDDIELQDYISNKQKNEIYLQKCVDFYDNQHDYSNLRDTLSSSSSSSNLFNEFEEIVTNILIPDPEYLINLHQL